jgi:cytochrome c biogenesis protein CcdA
MVTAAVFLWGYRDRLGRPRESKFNSRGRSSALVGATITAVELPTAFPYFAAIAAIVGSGYDVVRQIVYIVIFNICFVAPLLAMLLVLTIAGSNAQNVLQKVRGRLQKHWPAMLSILALVAGVFVILLGATGLASLGRGHLGIDARRLRHFLHP